MTKSRAKESVKTVEAIVELTTLHYASSHDANGYPVQFLLNESVTIEDVRPLVIEAVSNGKIEVVFYEIDGNAHVQRLPRKLRPSFEDALKTCDLSQACLYPSPEVIKAKVDLSRYDGQPYTMRLWSGGSSLDLVFFELAVLERYRNDPRYIFSLAPFGGAISTPDPETVKVKLPEKDDSFLRTFGIGYKEDGGRVLGAMLYQLRDLTAEHQRSWESFEEKQHCKLNEVSFNSWFWGKWPESGSMFEAVVAELAVINQLARSAFGEPFFKNEFPASIPKHFGVLLRPTRREYIEFAKALDVMLSENINKKFFPGWVPRTHTRVSDGREVTESVGTISLIESWLKRSFKPSDCDPIADICGPFKKVRKDRSAGSHKDTLDDYDLAHEDHQRELLTCAYNALYGLRQIFSLHPNATADNIPTWLAEGKIKIP